MSSSARKLNGAARVGRLADTIDYHAIKARQNFGKTTNVDDDRAPGSSDPNKFPWIAIGPELVWRPM